SPSPTLLWVEFFIGKLATPGKLAVLALAEYKVYLHFQAIWTGFNPSLFIALLMIDIQQRNKHQGEVEEQAKKIINDP
ncbi:hypothetical protein, partial [aff. Roholtiella sp. LEGE 12411]|uniref:hypothetical protein n=1 Tax=aff. Roholtiella sp. LEGE 12411 TaxID=1828822 RepID=UPI00187E4AFB